MVTILVIILMAAMLVALFFFFRNRQLQYRLKLELRDVNGNEGDKQTYRRVVDSGFNNNTLGEE